MYEKNQLDPHDPRTRLVPQLGLGGLLPREQRRSEERPREPVARLPDEGRCRDTHGEERREPTREEIDAKFWEVYPRCWAKILQEVKSGMIVTFVELGSFEPGTYQGLIDAPEEFLAQRYGKKKIKVNFYDGENFVCTINFKVAGWTEHEPHEKT